MSIFDEEERKMLEAEKEEAELTASIERQKELDEINSKIINQIDEMLDFANGIKTEGEEEGRSVAIMKDALTLYKSTMLVADRKVNESNNTVTMPEGFYLRQVVYMIPTPQNGLTEITAYNILGFGLSQIGPRADLSIVTKVRGVESLFCASFDMFNKSIFKSYEEAQRAMKG